MDSDEKKTISGLIITYNEEESIEECVKSLFNVCNEVIVIDSNSSDNTVKIAEELGAKVVRQNFLGDGPQRNFGLKYCKNEWVLNLDADERLDKDAIEEITKLDLNNTEYEAFELRRKNFYKKKWVKCCGWYPDFIRRLFNKDKTRFSDVVIHTKIESKNSKKLNSHIIHYAYSNPGELLDKANKYSEIFANHSKTKSSPFKATSHSLFAFFKNYFLQRGFLCGYEGLLISVSNANGVFYKYMKLYEKQKEAE